MLKNIKLLHIVYFASFFLLNHFYAEASSYCIRNQVMGSFTVYDKNGNSLGNISATKHMKGISTDSFPLTISTCSGGLKSCDNSGDNHTITKPDCYDVYYYAGYTSPRLACALCNL